MDGWIQSEDGRACILCVSGFSAQCWERQKHGLSQWCWASFGMQGTAESKAEVMDAMERLYRFAVSLQGAPVGDGGFADLPVSRRRFAVTGQY